MIRPLSPSCRLCACFGLAVVIGGGTLAAQSKDYRFFVGVDVLVPQEADFLEVANFANGAATLAAETPVQLSLDGVKAYRWARHPKISRATVAIEGLKADRTYSLNSDPKMGWMVTQNHMAIYAQERTEMQLATLVRTEEESQFYKGGPLESPYGAQGVPTQHEAMAQATGDFENTVASMEASTNPSTWGQLAGDDEGTEAFDTLDINFQLTSAEPLVGAYVVVLADIASKRQTGTVTVFQEVGALGPTPKKVRIRRQGLDPGFTVENVKVHVYAHGNELGTNLSDRATGLTREQARGYLLLAHLTDHKSGNILPSPVWELAPPALFANNDPKLFDFPVAVSIGPDGEVLSIHRSVQEAYDFLRVVDIAEVNTKATPGFKGGTAPADVVPAARSTEPSIDKTGALPPRVVAAINDFVFLPALKDGQPVKGIIAFNLAAFYR